MRNAGYNPKQIATARKALGPAWWTYAMNPAGAAAVASGVGALWNSIKRGHKAAKDDRPVPADAHDPADREDCPCCGAMHERGDGYCNSCGERWPAKTK